MHGGDGEDRTLDLLNAIQALSRYKQKRTPKRLDKIKAEPLTNTEVLLSEFNYRIKLYSPASRQICSLPIISSAVQLDGTETEYVIFSPSFFHEEETLP